MTNQHGILSARSADEYPQMNQVVKDIYVGLLKKVKNIKYRKRLYIQPFNSEHYPRNIIKLFLIYENSRNYPGECISWVPTFIKVVE